MLWIIAGMIIFLLILVVYIVLYTPYPFVWLLRSKKEVHEEKGPENIEEIKQRITIELGKRYPSRYPKATYDLYLPSGKIRALLVWVHGGSFIAGTSDGVRNFGPMMADQGIGICAINYALAPRHPFPSQIRQLDEVLVYLKQDVFKTRKFTFDAVFLGGDSAGANIVASYTTMLQNPALAREASVSLHNTLAIKGLLLYCGPYDFCEDMNREGFQQFKKFFNYIGWSYLGKKSWYTRKEKRLASPLHQLNDAFPPCYVCDGKKFSFLWQGKLLVEALQQRHIYVQSRFYESMTHEFQFHYKAHKEEAMQVFEDSLAFINHIEQEKVTKKS